MSTETEFLNTISSTNEIIQKVVSNVKRYAPESKQSINVLRHQVTQLCDLQNEIDHTKTIFRNLNAALAENSELELRQAFVQQIKAIPKPNQYDNHPFMQQFEKVLAGTINETPENTNEALDPFTKQPIKQVAKNKICGHIYDRDTIMEILKQQQKPRCPIVGCPSKKKISVRYLDIADNLQTQTENNFTLDESESDEN